MTLVIQFQFCVNFCWGFFSACCVLLSSSWPTVFCRHVMYNNGFLEIVLRKTHMLQLNLPKIKTTLMWSCLPPTGAESKLVSISFFYQLKVSTRSKLWWGFLLQSKLVSFGIYGCLLRWHWGRWPESTIAAVFFSLTSTGAQNLFSQLYFSIVCLRCMAPLQLSSSGSLPLWHQSTRRRTCFLQLPEKPKLIFGLAVKN